MKTTASRTTHVIGLGVLVSALIVSAATSVHAQNGLPGAASTASQASTAAAQSATRNIRDTEQARTRIVELRSHHHQSLHGGSAAAIRGNRMIQPDR